MEIDWEVEIGGDAPVIEAQWPGLIDLQRHPHRIDEIFEVDCLLSLRDLLLTLNSAKSPVWTSKCDVWEPEHNAIACYVDMLPREPRLFSDWRELGRFCQALVRRIAPEAKYGELQNPHPGRAFVVADESEKSTTLNLVIRRAVVGENDGYGMTAYFSAARAEDSSAISALAALMSTFSDVVMGFPPISEQS